MKKVLTLAFAAFLSLSSFADDISKNNEYTATQGRGKDITEGGFYLHLTSSFPSKRFGIPVPLTTAPSSSISLPKTDYSIGYGFELGNQFRIVDLDNMAIGLRATWFSASFNAYPDAIDFSLISASALNVGPYYTFALNDNMALTAYYQIAPQTAIDVLGNFYGGAIHKMGFNYQFKVFTVGAEYQIGKIKDAYYWGSTDSDVFGNTFPVDKNLGKIYTNNLRVNLGFKF